MKANKILFATVLSLITFQAMSPNEILSSRAPASALVSEAASSSASAAIQNSEIKIINNIIVASDNNDKKFVTPEEMKALQDKLALLEKSVKNKEALLAQKALQAEDKIQALTKTIAEQKSEIGVLKDDIKNSEIRDVEAQNKNNAAIEAILCKAESKGEKLEADIKKLLEDQQAVVKEVEGLKKENQDLKSKVAEKKEEPKKSENSELVALMAQMTTMFTTQMQSQMQMQVQMMSMLSQMQNNFMPQVSPYAFNPSQFSNIQSFGYPQAGQFGGFGNVGISAAATPWSDYQNPYSMMPSLNRQYLPQATDFGFDFSQPMVAPQQQRVPAEQGLPSPFRSQVIAV